MRVDGDEQVALGGHAANYSSDAVWIRHERQLLGLEEAAVMIDDGRQANRSFVGGLYERFESAGLRRHAGVVRQPGRHRGSCLAHHRLLGRNETGSRKQNNLHSRYSISMLGVLEVLFNTPVSYSDHTIRYGVRTRIGQALRDS